MNVKVRTLVRFIDKHTGETHEIGDEFTATKKRIAEIKKVGPFVEEVKDEGKADA